MQRIVKTLVCVSRDTHGGVLIYTALLMPIMLGLMGLVVDLAVWNLNKRTAQAMVDAAAVAAALEISRTGIGNVQAAVTGIAEVNSFDKDSDALTVNNPPADGPLSDVEDAIEVVMTREVPAFLSSIFIKGPVTVAARAVALGMPTDICVLALDRDSSEAISIAGGADVNLDCTAMANSRAEFAIRQTGNACLAAKRLQVSGGYSGDCLSPDPYVGMPQAEDPLAALRAPEVGSCDHENTVVVAGAGETILEPGHYCGGIAITGGGNITFDSGLYILGGVGLKIAGSANVTGTDVAFYLTESSGGITIAGSGSVSLEADTDGDLPGILFYQDRGSSHSTNKVLGNSETRLDGILYFPRQRLLFSGGSEVSPTASLLIANSITFAGNTEIGDVKDSPAMANSGLLQARLVQ